MRLKPSFVNDGKIHNRVLNRLLSRDPSNRILFLEEIRGENIYSDCIFASETCRDTPANIITSLVVELHKQDFIYFYKKHNIQPPSIIIEPIRMMKNVPIFMNEGSDQFIADNFLYKRASGNHNGLIITGELAGLIATRSKRNNNLFIPERFWNDLQTDEFDPSFPNFLPQDIPNQPEFLQLLQNKLKIFLAEEFEAPKICWTSDVFFSLCKRLFPGLPKIDESNFFYTQPISVKSNNLYFDYN